FRGIGNNDAALFYFPLFNRLHQHPISERSYINCCHTLSSLLLLFWVEPATPKAFGAADKLSSLLFLVFVDDFEFRIDDIAIAAASTCAWFSAGTRLRFRPSWSSASTGGSASLGGGLLVKLGADFLEFVLQIVIRALDRV